MTSTAVVPAVVRPKRLIGRGWPRLAGARGSLRHAPARRERPPGVCQLPQAEPPCLLHRHTSWVLGLAFSPDDAQVNPNPNPDPNPEP